MVQSPFGLQRKMDSNHSSEKIFNEHKKLSGQVSQCDDSFIEKFDSNPLLEPLIDNLVTHFEDDTRKRKPFALFFSGLLHEKGMHGFVKDLNKAAEFYHAASQANHAPATYALQKLYIVKNSPENHSCPGYLVMESEEMIIETRVTKLLQNIAQGHVESEIDLSELCQQETVCKILKGIRGQLETEIINGKLVLDETLADNMLKLAYLIIAANTSENKESYREAYGLISSSKDLKNSGALFYLSAMYRFGVGVPISREEAGKCLEKSASLRNIFAMISLVSEFINCSVGNEDLHFKGLELSHELSQVGSSIGFFNLGLCSLHGIAAVQQDIHEAVKYFELSAVAIDYQHSGHTNSESLFNLGIIFDSGIMGLERDFKKAAGYYTVSVKSGNPKACVQLAKLYEKGRGVKQDLDKSVFLLHKVSKLGQVHFLDGTQGRNFDPHLVAFITGYGNYRNGRVNEKCGNQMKAELSYRLALKAFEFLVKNSYKSCAVLYLLGKLYHKGRGPTVCIVTAQEFYHQAIMEASKTYDIFEKEFSRKADNRLKDIVELLARRESSVDLSDLSERLMQHNMHSDADQLKLPKSFLRPVVSRVESFTSVDEREIDDILNSIDKLPGFEHYKADHNESITEESSEVKAMDETEGPTNNEEDNDQSENSRVMTEKINQPVVETVDSERRESGDYELESNATISETLSDDSSLRRASSLWSNSRPQSEGKDRLVPAAQDKDGVAHHQTTEEESKNAETSQVKCVSETLQSVKTELSDDVKHHKQADRKLETVVQTNGGVVSSREDAANQIQGEGEHIQTENNEISKVNSSNHNGSILINGNDGEKDMNSLSNNDTSILLKETQTAASVKNNSESERVAKLDNVINEDNATNKPELNGHIKEEIQTNIDNNETNMNGVQNKHKNKGNKQSGKKPKSSKVCVIV